MGDLLVVFKTKFFFGAPHAHIHAVMAVKGPPVCLSPTLELDGPLGLGLASVTPVLATATTNVVALRVVRLVRAAALRRNRPDGEVVEIGVLQSTLARVLCDPRGGDDGHGDGGALGGLLGSPQSRGHACPGFGGHFRSGHLTLGHDQSAGNLSCRLACSVLDHFALKICEEKWYNQQWRFFNSKYIRVACEIRHDGFPRPTPKRPQTYPRPIPK